MQVINFWLLIYKTWGKKGVFATRQHSICILFFFSTISTLTIFGIDWLHSKVIYVWRKAGNFFLEGCLLACTMSVVVRDWDEVNAQVTKRLLLQSYMIICMKFLLKLTFTNLIEHQNSSILRKFNQIAAYKEKFVNKIRSRDLLSSLIN